MPTAAEAAKEPRDAKLEKYVELYHQLVEERTRARSIRKVVDHLAEGVEPRALERDGAQRRGRGGDVAAELEPRTGSARSKKTKINREYRQLMMEKYPNFPFMWDTVRQPKPTLTNGLRGPTDVLSEIRFVLDVGITTRRGPCLILRERHATRLFHHNIPWTNPENTRNTELTSLHAVGIWRGNREASETRSGKNYQPFKWDLTPEDKSEPAFIGDVLKLISYEKAGQWLRESTIGYEDFEKEARRLGLYTAMKYENQKGFFTVAEVIEIILQFERIDRAKVHASGNHSHSLDHIYFEGLMEDGDAWSIAWGS